MQNYKLKAGDEVLTSSLRSVKGFTRGWNCAEKDIHKYLGLCKAQVLFSNLIKEMLGEL